MTRLSNRQFPMLQTFVQMRPAEYMTIERAQAYDQRPFRSMLIQQWVVYLPGRGFHITPPGVFHCHTTREFVCTGWAQCHADNPPGHELLALRLAQAFSGATLKIPAPVCALFHSGRAAALHGLRDLARPRTRARRMLAKLMAMRDRRDRREGA